MSRLIQIVLFTSVGSFLLGYGAAHIDWNNQNAPAWVQGVGSVLAIFVAIAVPWYQQKKEGQREEKARLALRAARLLSYSMYALQVRKVMNELIGEISARRMNDGYRKMANRSLEHALSGMQAIGFEALTTEEALAANGAMIMIVDLFTATGSEHHFSAESAPNHLPIIEQQRDAISNRISTLDKSYKAITGHSTLEADPPVQNG